jgi:apolipoprotein D and lipocalin family protein
MMRNPEELARMARESKATKVALGVAATAAASAAVWFGWRAWWHARHCGNPDVPEPAKPVDLARYAGKWYELARYDNRFERGCRDVTAEYVARSDGLIDVINACETAEGEHQVAHGRAKVVPDSGDAKLKVSFFGPFYTGDYWVLDHDEDYQWAIVGEPSGCYLWLLHREATPEPSQVSSLRQRAGALGYDLRKLRRTRQSGGG